MKSNGSFLGRFARFFVSDQHYRLYVTPDCLCGAYLAGQYIHKDDRTHGDTLVAIAMFIMSFVVERNLAKLKNREERYCNLDPTSPEFLSEDRRNFQFYRTQITSIIVDRKRSRHVYLLNRGTVTIKTTTGKTLRFILDEHTDPDDVVAMLRQFYPDTKIEGKAPRLPSTESEEKVAWIGLLCIALFLLGTSVLAILSSRHHPNPIERLPLGIMLGFASLIFFYLAGSHLRKHVKASRDSKDEKFEKDRRVEEASRHNRR